MEIHLLSHIDLEIYYSHLQGGIKEYSSSQMPAEYSCDEKRRRMSSSGSSSRCAIKTKQPGVAPSLLHSGSTFRGQQRSQGSCYQVDVVLQVPFIEFICRHCNNHFKFTIYRISYPWNVIIVFKDRVFIFISYKLPHAPSTSATTSDIARLMSLIIVS